MSAAAFKAHFPTEAEKLVVVRGLVLLLYVYRSQEKGATPVLCSVFCEPLQTHTHILIALFCSGDQRRLVVGEELSFLLASLRTLQKGI